ncbi:hypothetical protein [Chitinivibrio alkaliphilus]|nr:hypothetical protein [Chitinivibrio alkaliphilus]
MQFLLLYPEIHFRFKGVSPSLLFRREPEILFDMPRRIAPNKPVELFLIINDTDRFPITLREVTVHICRKNHEEEIRFSPVSSYEIPHLCSEKTALYRFTLYTEAPRGETLRIYPTLHYTNTGKNASCSVDNFRTTGKAPLLAYGAEAPYPGPALYADLHCHSVHSRSHVEFGAPLWCINRAVELSGLSTAAVVDHSYDLACHRDNYLLRDSSLSNWKDQQQQRKIYRKLFISEEVSARKKRGGVVHLGVLGTTPFIPGSGDGARKGYSAKAEPTLSQILKKYGNAAVLYAAHPGAPVPYMQRLFLRRGTWTMKDFSSPHIHAYQLLNGPPDISWVRARKLWIRLLLKGKKLPVIAGNDAHGDFNRYRMLRVPFLWVGEDHSRYFGSARTGIYEHNPQNMCAAIRAGKTFVTTGPYLAIHRTGIPCISKTPVTPSSLSIVAESSQEFGPLQSLRLFCGDKTTRKEISHRIPLHKQTYTATHLIPPALLEDSFYIRVELYTEKGAAGAETMAATSPVYLK